MKLFSKKRLVAFASAFILVFASFFILHSSDTSNTAYAERTLSASDAAELETWICEELGVVPHNIVLSIGGDSLNVDMSGFYDDGYIIKKLKKEVVILGKTYDGLILACQKYISDIKLTGDCENTVYHDNAIIALPNPPETPKPQVEKLTIAFKTDSRFLPQKNTDVFLDFTNIKNSVPVDLFVHGGDLIDGNHETEDIALDTLRTAVNSMTSGIGNIPFVNLRGNHDDNSWVFYARTNKRYGVFPDDGIISSDQWRDMTFTNSDSIVTDGKGCYGYWDHEESKIRVLFVDTSDIPYTADENGICYYGAYTGHGIRNDQLNFMAEALMFSDKGDDAENWAVLIVSHVPIETMKSTDNPYRFGGFDATGRNFYAFLRILEAYKNGTFIHDETSSLTNYGDGGYKNGDKKGDFSYRVTADFSKNGPGEVIALICGHTHIDNYSTLVGKDSHRNEYTKIYPELSLGYSYVSIGSNGFAVITVERNGAGTDTGTVYVDKHGTSVVTNNCHIAETDDAIYSYDPVAKDIYSSSPLIGSIPSGHYAFEYSQHRKTNS